MGLEDEHEAVDKIRKILAEIEPESWATVIYIVICRMVRAIPEDKRLDAARDAVLKRVRDIPLNSEWPRVID